MKKAIVLSLALISSSALAGNNAPLIEVVTAHSELQLTGTPAVTSCIGVDGTTYTLTHLTAAGPTTSSDPRLAGTFNADARLFHNAQGVGISRDDFTITDPATGRVKVQGTAYAMDDGTAPIKGQVVAQLADGSQFWAMSTVQLPASPGGSLIIDYGTAVPGVPLVPDRANVIMGHCGDSNKMFGPPNLPSSEDGNAQ